MLVLKKTNFKFNLNFFLECRKLLIPGKFTLERRVTSNIIMQDLLRNVVTWRHVYGYPVNGQSTHTNSKNSRKNKKYFNYRHNQFLKLFGKTRKSKKIMYLILKAEYTNRLWYRLWFNEWKQANFSYYKLKKRNSNAVSFDLTNLARGQVNGFIRVGAASKLGKAKRITNRGTIGVPILFAKNLIWGQVTRVFPYRLLIHSEGKRRKKKLRRKKKKKSKVKKKKKKILL